MGENGWNKTFALGQIYPSTSKHGPDCSMPSLHKDAHHLPLRPRGVAGAACGAVISDFSSLYARRASAAVACSCGRCLPLAVVLVLALRILQNPMERRAQVLQFQSLPRPIYRPRASGVVRTCRSGTAFLLAAPGPAVMYCKLAAINWCPSSNGKLELESSRISGCLHKIERDGRGRRRGPGGK